MSHTLPAGVREQVRERVSFRCEFCGVTEADAGGELTVDHFQPRVQRGPDTLDNLIYSCHRCNLYKADYWPASPEHPSLWNPRQGPAAAHLLELADGMLHPISPAGALTLQRLRLNRPALITYRLKSRAANEELHLLQRYQQLVVVLEQMQRQHVQLLQEQQNLLEQQRSVLRLLLGSQDP